MVSLVVPFNRTYGTPTGIKALEFTLPSPEFATQILSPIPPFECRKFIIS
jgi:hypothetical protein